MSSRSPAASTRRCTGSASGPCGSTPGFGSAAETNKRYRFLLEQGQTGPLGRVRSADPDGLRPGRVHGARRGRARSACRSPRSRTCRISSRDSARPRVDLDDDQRHRVDPAGALRGGRERARASRRARSAGTVQNDILKEYIARGTYIFPPGPSMRLVTDTFAYCRDAGPALEHDLDLRLPHARGRLHRGAGGGLHAGERHRLRAGGAGRRASPSTTSRRSSRSSSTRTTTSSRRSPSSARRGGCGRGSCASASARATRASLTLRFHAQTAGSTLTAQQPENNIVRVAVQALAAVLGGCQSLHTNSMDEALALPTEQRRADRAPHPADPRRTSPGWPTIADPLGGALRRSSASPATSRRRRASTSRRSTTWAARSPPSRSCSARSRTRPTATSARSRITRGSSSASTSSSPDEPPPGQPLPGGRGRRPAALAERVARARATRDRAAVGRALDALERGARGRDQPRCRCW